MGQFEAILDSQTSRWSHEPDPTLAPKFRGYKLDKKQQPTFLYQFGNVKVADTPQPAQTGQGFGRTLVLEVPKGSASDKVLYFRALAGHEVRLKRNEEIVSKLTASGLNRIWIDS